VYQPRPFLLPYSPKCLEMEFSEVGIAPVLAKLGQDRGCAEFHAGARAVGSVYHPVSGYGLVQIGVWLPCGYIDTLASDRIPR